MSLPPIRTVGDPILRERCREVTWPAPELDESIEILAGALRRFREQHGYGRAISAPQVGRLERLIVIDLGEGPFAVINPEPTWTSDETMLVWDDCLSVPEHVVRVRRHRSISLVYRDRHGRQRQWERLPESLSELLQHEMDHLDGVLMLDRATGPDAVRPISEHAALVGAQRAEPSSRTTAKSE